MIKDRNEAEAMLAQLSDFYGESVRPASAFCAALVSCAQAWRTNPMYRPEAGAFLRIVNGISVRKSALLGRVLYGGEAVRTEKCPEHKGVWSGLDFPGEECPHGCGKTGWLPIADALREEGGR